MMQEFFRTEKRKSEETDEGGERDHNRAEERNGFRKRESWRRKLM